MAKRILVVDDEPSMIRLVEVHLSRAGYEVATALDGHSALAEARRQHPDLILLDVEMPFMDGLEVVMHLRQDAATAEIPVIMVTGQTPNATLSRRWQWDHDGWLTKPFSPVDLISLVQSRLDTIEQATGGATPEQ